VRAEDDRPRRVVVGWMWTLVLCPLVDRSMASDIISEFYSRSTVPLVHVLLYLSHFEVM
jgi:hypothetical protein